MFLLLAATIIVLAAHVSRKQLPLHPVVAPGIYKIVGFASAALIAIFAYDSADQV